jgi:hypothetical protein
MPDAPPPPDTVYLSLPPPPKRRYPLRILTACALILLTGIIVGCMSISFGGRSSEARDDGLLEQEGEVEVKEGMTQTVYYPVPYASPPNLVIDNFFGNVEIEEQAWDHFRVRGVKVGLAVEWKAKGLRGPPAPPPIVVAPVGPPSESAKH